MGNGGAKKTNQMLGQQTAANNALASNMGGKGEAEYAQRTGLRDEVLGEYRKRLNGEGEFGGGGGGGGYAFTPGTARMNEGMGTAREFMNTGGWTPEQISNERSWSTAPISGLYEGLKNQLNRRAVGSGVGYSGGMGRLARDSAYQMGDQANRTSMGINENIRSNRLAGMGAVGGFDSEFMNREDALRREANSNAASQAASRSSAANNDQAWDMRYLQGMEGLIGNDLPYWDRQQGAINSGTQSVGMRQDETPLWQKSLASLGPSALSAGIGAFSGGGGGFKNPFSNKKPQASSGASSGYGAYGSW
jgi:hypothetical protein